MERISIHRWDLATREARMHETPKPKVLVGDTLEHDQVGSVRYSWLGLLILAVHLCFGFFWYPPPRLFLVVL